MVVIARAQNVQSHDRLAIGGQAGALQTQATKHAIVQFTIVWLQLRVHLNPITC